MNVVLIDRMGNWREMAVTHLPVRVPRYEPLTCRVDADPSALSVNMVAFRESWLTDSRLVDDRDWPILTPDGQDVPLGKFTRPVFRCGPQLYADVYVSDSERFSALIPIEDLAWRVAQGPLRALVADPSVWLSKLAVNEQIRDAPTRVSTYRVFAEMRVPV